jgi:hypothetical protein
MYGSCYCAEYTECVTPANFAHVAGDSKVHTVCCKEHLVLFFSVEGEEDTVNEFCGVENEFPFNAVACRDLITVV